MGMSKYSNKLKREVCRKICDERQSTMLTAQKYSVPLKTVEKWVTQYNKDPEHFNRPDDYLMRVKKKKTDRYNNMTPKRLIKELKSRDVEIENLKSLLLVRELSD